MDHKIIKYMAVVEHSSFTEAAKQLHVSQPALSVAIKKLEQNFGVQLIIRNGNFFQVTKAGESTYECGVRMRTQLKNLKTELGMKSDENKLLRIGMLDSVADRLFSSSMDIVGQLDVRIDNSSRLLMALKHDQLDIAFIVSPLNNIGTSYKILGSSEEKFTAVCASNIATSAQKKIKEDRTIDNLLTYDKASTTFQWMKRYFTELGIAYFPKFYSTNPELILKMALNSNGVALLPNLKIEEDVTAGRLARLSSIDFRRTIISVVLKGKSVGEEEKKLVELTHARLA